MTPLDKAKGALEAAAKLDATQTQQEHILLTHLVQIAQAQALISIAESLQVLLVRPSLPTLRAPKGTVDVSKLPPGIVVLEET